MAVGEDTLIACKGIFTASVHSALENITHINLSSSSVQWHQTRCKH